LTATEAASSVMGFIASCHFGEEQQMTARNTTHDVYITQLVKPKIVNSICRHKEVPFRQLFVDLVSRHVQPIEDPLLHKALVSGGLVLGLEWRGNMQQRPRTFKAAPGTKS
jgi:hypothetical protein